MTRKLKLKDAMHLMKSNMYILITGTKTSIFGDFMGMDSDMKLRALKESRDTLNKEIKAEEKSRKLIK